jgi:hypothetical protein
MMLRRFFLARSLSGRPPRSFQETHPRVARCGPNPPDLRSNLRGDLFQADQAGELAHFALLVLA